MTIEDMIYKIWENPKTKDIEADVEKFIDSLEDIEKKDIDTIVNHMYNITDKYPPSSEEWAENVVKLIEKYVGEECE